MAETLRENGDPVEIKIGGVPQDEQLQVNNTYVVDSSGSVSLPYINKVRAAGLAPSQFAREVETASGEIVAAAKADNYDAARAAAGKITKACTGCHGAFR